MSEFLTVRHVKHARKQYRCDDCGHPICVGEHYRYWCEKQEGEVMDAHVHEECAAWANAVMNTDEGRCFLEDADPSDEWEDEFPDAVRANPPSDIVRSRLPLRWLVAVDKILEPKP